MIAKAGARSEVGTRRPLKKGNHRSLKWRENPSRFDEQKGRREEALEKGKGRKASRRKSSKREKNHKFQTTERNGGRIRTLGAAAFPTGKETARSLCPRECRGNAMKENGRRFSKRCDFNKRLQGELDGFSPVIEPKILSQ